MFPVHILSLILKVGAARNQIGSHWVRCDNGLPSSFYGSRWDSGRCFKGVNPTCEEQVTSSNKVNSSLLPCEWLTSDPRFAPGRCAPKGSQSSSCDNLLLYREHPNYGSSNLRSYFIFLILILESCYFCSYSNLTTPATFDNSYFCTSVY